MAVGKTKDGRWYVSYWNKEKQKPGRDYFGKGSSGQKKAVQEDRKRNPRKYLNGRKKNNDGYLFKELINLYLKDRKNRTTESEKASIIPKINAFIVPRLGDYYAHTLDDEILNDYIETRQTIEKVKNVTINRDLDLIQAVLNWGVRKQKLIVNPVLDFDRLLDDSETIPPPTNSEIERLLEHSPEHLRRFLLLAFYLGVRPGPSELTGIKWFHVNFDRDQIFIKSAKKGGDPERWIDIHYKFRPVLEYWHEKDDNENREIVQWKGKPVNSVKTAFKNAKAQAKIFRRLRLYDFRHAFATNILREDGDIKSLSKIMGHTREDTTRKFYQHVTGKDQKRTMNKLPGLDFDPKAANESRSESRSESPPTLH